MEILHFNIYFRRSEFLKVIWYFIQSKWQRFKFTTLCFRQLAQLGGQASSIHFAKHPNKSQPAVISSWSLYLALFFQKCWCNFDHHNVDCYQTSGARQIRVSNIDVSRKYRVRHLWKFSLGSQNTIYGNCDRNHVFYRNGYKTFFPTDLSCYNVQTHLVWEMKDFLGDSLHAHKRQKSFRPKVLEKQIENRWSNMISGQEQVSIG